MGLTSVVKHYSPTNPTNKRRLRKDVGESLKEIELNIEDYGNVKSMRIIIDLYDEIRDSAWR